ncbi:hypothetical protein GJ698_00755 [Pseudoduganella sp. FT26W]|uniref:Uncharacterized protein n=1 Tax=Duganella aquatilis TaxID=2666082 RepID=A0A844D536_9BURK|nr:hypothetical protein [Duganella aquatilis]MRW82620.1 hypothetical protein [Duganella aquatilis]
MADGTHFQSSSTAVRRTIMMTIKPTCLALQELAKKYGTKKEKAPENQGLSVIRLPSGANRYGLENHSHSMVAGGLPEMS